MSIEIWFPAALTLLGAIAWFMSMMAGVWLIDARQSNSWTAKAWYGCSILAVEWLVIFAWIAGRSIPSQ